MSTEKKDMRLNRGFWAGLLSFVIAKIASPINNLCIRIIYCGVNRW